MILARRFNISGDNDGLVVTTNGKIDRIQVARGQSEESVTVGNVALSIKGKSD